MRLGSCNSVFAQIGNTKNKKIKKIKKKKQMQGHQNYISKVATETLMTAGNSLTDVCLVVRIVVVSLLLT